MSTADIRSKQDLTTLPGKNMARVLSVMEMFGLDADLTKKRGIEGVGYDFALKDTPLFKGKLRCLDDGEVGIDMELQTESAKDDPKYKRTGKTKTDADRIRLAKELEQHFRFMGFKRMDEVA